MPEISIQKQCAGLTDLVNVESFGEPIGDLPLQTDNGFYSENDRILLPEVPILPKIFSFWL